MPTMTLDEFAEKEMALAKEQEEKQKQFQMEKPDSDSEMWLIERHMKQGHGMTGKMTILRDLVTGRNDALI